MAMYSHSKLSSFEQCKLRYKFRYIDKIKPEIEKSIEAHLGTAVHSALEWLYKQVQENKIPEIDDLLVTYTEEWQKEFSPGILIVKKHLTSQDYYNKGIKFLIDYYFTNKPFDENTLELEKRIFLNLTDQHKLQGYIDRLTYNLQTNEYEIHDYKTANSLPSQKKIDNDRQLALYSIAIKEIFGQEKKVSLIWHYLNFNQKIISKRTDQQLEQLKKDIIELINKIESTTEFPATNSILCNWCEFKTLCPEFQSHSSSPFS
jgi:putative RecB family exonuclease